MTKNHNLGAFNNINQTSGGYKSQTKVLVTLVLVRSLFLACEWSPSHYVLPWQRGSPAVSSGEDTNPTESEPLPYDLI